MVVCIVACRVVLLYGLVVCCVVVCCCVWCCVALHCVVVHYAVLCDYDVSHCGMPRCPVVQGVVL